MLKKYIYTIFAIGIFLSPIGAQEPCEIFYTSCEISNMIYKEYIDSTSANEERFAKGLPPDPWIQGYSYACLTIYLQIHMIDDY